MSTEYPMKAVMWTATHMRQSVAAIEAEIGTLEIQRKRALLLAGDWTQDIDSLTDEQVEAEYAKRQAVESDEPYDEGWKSEDYDTIAEADARIFGLHLAIHALRTTHGDEREPVAECDHSEHIVGPDGCCPECGERM